jgi:hypothetical protein
MLHVLVIIDDLQAVKCIICQIQAMFCNLWNLRNFTSVIIMIMDYLFLKESFCFVIKTMPHHFNKCSIFLNSFFSNTLVLCNGTDKCTRKNSTNTTKLLAWNALCLGVNLFQGHNALTELTSWVQTTSPWARSRPTNLYATEFTS